MAYNTNNTTFPALLLKEMLYFSDRLENILETHNIESDDIVYVKFFLKTLGEEPLMAHAIKKILPWKKYIMERDENFFYKNKEIFGKLPEDKVNYFSDLWVSGKLDEEDKTEIWDFFEAFVTIIEEYKKKN